MTLVVDTNVLILLIQKDDPRHDQVRDALRSLRARGDSFAYTPQIMGELWQVATQTGEGMGLGLSAEEADRRLRLIERHFELLLDNADTHASWRRLLVAHSVEGAVVHHARLVASMLGHGITHLLTWDPLAYARFAEITAVDPEQAVNMAQLPPAE